MPGGVWGEGGNGACDSDGEEGEEREGGRVVIICLPGAHSLHSLHKLWKCPLHTLCSSSGGGEGGRRAGATWDSTRVMFSRGVGLTMCKLVSYSDFWPLPLQRNIPGKSSVHKSWKLSVRTESCSSQCNPISLKDVSIPLRRWWGGWNN